MKKLLLDSHVLLWAFGDPKRLSKEIQELISDPNNSVYYSTASTWELMIKKTKQKLNFPDNFFALIEQEHFTELPITTEHVINLEGLPSIHNDPFDRMLIAQALCEDLHIISADRDIAKYKVKIISL